MKEMFAADGHRIPVTKKRRLALSEVCSRCPGKCCRALRVHVPLRPDGKVDRKKLRSEKDNKDSSPVADNFVRIKDTTGRDPRLFGTLFTCKQFDRRKNICKVYDKRPPMCRSYACHPAVYSGNPPDCDDESATMFSDEVGPRIKVGQKKPTRLWKSTFGRYKAAQAKRAAELSAELDSREVEAVDPIPIAEEHK